jgi:hypothetical protein
MNYDNYEKKIVERYGIALKRWPSGHICNPGKLGGHEDVTKLLQALQSGSCQWTKLTDDELEKWMQRNLECEGAGEQVYNASQEENLHRKEVQEC